MQGSAAAGCHNDVQTVQRASFLLVPWLVACGVARGDEPRVVAGQPGTGTGTGTGSASGSASGLGVVDRGIWSDLDDRVTIDLPAGLDAARVTATIDPDRKLLVLAVDGWPVKPYPLAGDTTLAVGERRLPLRARDRAELAPLLRADNLRVAPVPAAADHDRDGLPDALDVVLGARKTVLNGDAYVSGYHRLAYPGGDVPRTIGVCTDVIVRALRNAGVDLQVELQRDLRRAPKAYPMVKRAGDANIDHRRVKTLLPYFLRHLERHTTALDDARDPLRPGDVVFFDTFPDRAGPDHIGIISDRPGPSGLPLVVNNWTDGTVTTEMDLLGWVPVMYRFRLR